MPNIVRWDPFAELDQVRHAMDRIFGDFRPFRPDTGAEVGYIPLDVSETDDAFEVQAALPGVKPDDVDFVSILSEDVPPLVAGQIDTAILHVEQFMLAKSKKPDLHVLAKLWEVAPTQLYNAFVVKEDTIAKRRKDVVGMTKAIIRGTRVMYSDKRQVMPILVKHTGLDEKIVSAAYDELVANCVWDANHGLSKERVNSTAQQMKKVGNIKGDVPRYDAIVDLSIAEAALSALGPWKGPVCSN